MKNILCLATLVAAGGASATTLTFTGVADDFFEAYLSTNDSVQGTQFVAQVNTWQSGAVTGNIVLTPNVTHYLHIRARDTFGAPSMFIGSASLSDNLFFFDNATQALSTNNTNWQLSLTGFGSNYVVPADLGANGSGPWGFHNGISATARRLWSPTGAAGEHYFTARINAVVPEPATFAIAGLALLGLRRRRRA